MKTTLAIAAAVTAGLCASIAQAQTVPAAPVAKPAAALDQLKVFSGKWTCNGDQSDSIFGPSHPIQTVATGKTDLDGFWMAVRYEEQKTKDNDHPTTGVYQYGFDPATKQIIATWTDSVGGWGTQTSAGFAAGKLVLVGDYNTNGQKIAARDTFVQKDAKTLTHTSELQVMGQWVSLQAETCTQ